MNYSRLARLILFGATLLALAPAPRAGVDDFNADRIRERDLRARVPSSASSPAPVAASATMAPAYALSARADELAQIVLAETPAGPVSALDLLMFDRMSSNEYQDIPPEIFLDLTSLRAAPYLPRIRQAVTNFATIALIAQRAGEFTPAADQLRVLTHGAAMATWIEQRIAPNVHVNPADIDRFYLAHAEDYLQRRRVQVRYIYIPANPAAEDINTRHEQLDALRRRIIAGELTFDEAARQTSHAPSKEDGGLIPSFYERTYFEEFENQAFALNNPGDISSVFRGPDGVYLIQLVKSWPPENIQIAAVSDEIRERLNHEHVRHYYAYSLEELARERYVQNNAYYWGYLNLETPVAQVNKTILRRAQFLRYYPNPTDPAYNVQWQIVMEYAARWAEGELVLQELERAGGAESPYIARARELGTIWLRAQEAFRREIDPRTIADTDAALAMLTADPAFTQSLRTVRLLRFVITPDVDLSMPPSRVRTAERAATAFGETLRTGTLPAEPKPLVLSEWYAQNNANDETLLTQGIVQLAAQASQSPWVDLNIVVEDLGWQPAFPGTAWSDVLKGIGPGQVSRDYVIGTTHYIYFNANEQPVDINLWREKPFYIENLAYLKRLGDVYNTSYASATEPDRIQFTF